MKYCKKCKAERTGNFCSVCGSGLVEAKMEICCPKCGITYKAGSYCLEDGTKLVRKVVLPTDEVEPVAVRPVSPIVSTSPKGHAISNQNSVKQTAPKIVSASSAQPSSQSNPDKWPLWKWILVFVAVAALMMVLDSIGVSPATRNTILHSLKHVL